MAKDKPPFMPAGIDSCSPSTLSRWRADKYRYAPCQYKRPYLVFNNYLKKLKPLNGNSRELMMGFRRPHTFNCQRTAELPTPKVMEAIMKI